MSDDTAVEGVAQFDARARAFIEANLPRLSEPAVDSRQLQNLLYDNGFAGIAFPTRYGGAGLTLQHQAAFFIAAGELGRQVPTTYMVSIGMLGPTLLEHGSEEARLRFLPPLLRGDEVWIQLLSEPRGGSDMAGSITRLTRDGDTYVLNGAKMWSTDAHTADFGLCLCRTNWDAPKHRGLSTIAVPLKGTPGVTIEQIRAADGRLGEFCQEFFDDVRLPAGNLIGDENQGWGVAQTLLFHERNAVGNIGYGHLKSIPGEGTGAPRIPVSDLVAIARDRGLDGVLAPQLADAYIESVVGPLTSNRIAVGNRIGTHQGQWGSLSKLQHSVWVQRTARTALAALGPDGVIWDGEEVRFDNAGTAWLSSRGGTIAGGTNEMQRNIISERLLGLPREPASDRDVPFNEVLRTLGKG